MKINYLEGPVSLSHFVNTKTGIQIYIFGDRHILRSNCTGNIIPDMDIAEFINYIIESTSEKINIFIEGPIIPNNKVYNAIDYIGKVEKLLLLSKPKNLRYNNIDLRSIKDTKLFTYSNYIEKIYDYIITGNIPTSKLEDEKFKFENIINSTGIFQHINNTKLYDYFKDYYERHIIYPSIYFNMVTELRDEYINYIYPTFKNIIQIIYTPYASIKIIKPMPLYLKKWLQKVNNVFEISMAGISSLQDMYCISLLLKDNIKNVIIYVGYAHVELYNELLTSLGFDLIEESKDSFAQKYDTYKTPASLDIEGQQCLYIGNFSQPFFH